MVVKEALEIMFDDGLDKLTIGSCCLSEYKNIISKSLNPNIIDYDEMFPKLDLIPIEECFGALNADQYIRRSYRGGWCYLVKGKENKVYNKGITLDVNSLYPSVMHSESGSRYPIGHPTFWVGDIPDIALKDDKYFFVRFKCKFNIKENYLPFLQIKNNGLYRKTECLTTSDIYDKETGKYYDKYYDFDGSLQDAFVEFTLTKTDYFLFLEHYDVSYLEILDGCWFHTTIGLFDDYIDKYKKIKMESTGCKKQIAKLMLNNLYGKMATNDNSSFKVAYIKEDGAIGFIPVKQHDKQVGYIPVGSAITSYARNFTIRAAQKNYYGEDKPGFIYADTDSIHIDLPIEKVKGLKIDDVNFNCWKYESDWDRGIFVRQKTYIEYVTHENQKPVTAYHNIKCAGMPTRCKQLIQYSFDGVVPNEELTEDEKYFLYGEEDHIIKREYKDFKIGLAVPGKLIPKRIPGGVVLKPTTYVMR